LLKRHSPKPSLALLLKLEQQTVPGTKLPQPHWLGEERYSETTYHLTTKLT
jgi:hypothetical protein